MFVGIRCASDGDNDEQRWIERTHPSTKGDVVGWRLGQRVNGESEDYDDRGLRSRSVVRFFRRCLRRAVGAVGAAAASAAAVVVPRPPLLPRPMPFEEPAKHERRDDSCSAHQPPQR